MWNVFGRVVLRTWYASQMSENFLMAEKQSHVLND
jgi:hypothetical protein